MRPAACAPRSCSASWWRSDAAAAVAEPLLAVESVDVVLGRGWRASQILSGVDLTVWPGEIVGLVGETGSGKTTLARTVAGLVDPVRGRVVLGGTVISALRRGARRAERRRGHLQLVFQDPLRSLDPDLTVADIVAEGLRIRGAPPPRSASGSPPRWTRSAWTPRCSAAPRARSPAASGSGCPSPAPWPPSRSC